MHPIVSNAGKSPISRIFVPSSAQLALLFNDASSVHAAIRRATWTCATMCVVPIDACALPRPRAIGKRQTGRIHWQRALRAQLIHCPAGWATAHAYRMPWIFVGMGTSMPVSERGVVGHNASGELRLSLEIFVVEEEIAVNERLRRSGLVDRAQRPAKHRHSDLEERSRHRDFRSQQIQRDVRKTAGFHVN